MIYYVTYILILPLMFQILITSPYNFLQNTWRIYTAKAIAELSNLVFFYIIKYKFLIHFTKNNVM